MFNVYSDLFFGRLHFFSQKNLKAVAPVHFSYRHGRHGGGHTAIWGGVFDWWWYALLLRDKQITRVFGGEVKSSNLPCESV